MNSTMVIAQRELIEKRFVFVAATAFLLLALIIPFMPGVHVGERGTALVIGSMGLASIFTLGLAAILGSSIIGRDLSDGRLSFYFAKPVPATAIWWGKIIAAVVLLGGCYAIIAFPAFLGSRELAPRDGIQLVTAVPIVAAALFLLAHVIGTFVRSRSAWFVVDFVAFSIVATAIWMLARPLLDGFAIELLWRLGKIAAAFAGLTILAAGAWQIARGRTDRTRSHKELSRFLWTTFGCGLLILSAYVAWVVSATPGDIAVPDFAIQSSGPWSFIGGHTKNRMDYHAAFLYNIDSGRSLRLARTPGWWAAFSNDGKVAVWWVPAKDGDEVHFAQLDSAKPRDIEAPFRLTRMRAFNISPDGLRMVTIDKDGILTVDDLRSGKSLGSARAPGATYWNPVFLHSDLLRVYAYNNGATTIYEYDVNRKTMTPTGGSPGAGARFNADRSRMLLFTKGGMEVHDARSGALLQSLPGTFYNARFLHDSRVVAIARDQRSLQIFSEAATLNVPLKIAGESIYEAPSGLITTCGRGSCSVIDAQSGAVLRTETGVYPLSYVSSAAGLLARSKSKLMVWNPATGEQRPIR